MDTLLHVSVRSVAVAALAALCLWRVKSAAWKHAVWTMVAASMLFQLVFHSMLAPLPLPLLRPVELVAVPVTIGATPMPQPSPEPVRVPLVPALYCAGVIFFAVWLLRAFVFTRRLIRRSELIAPGRYQSRELAVPVAAGSKILLPLAWSGWDAAKLRAVLAHEEAHVRRHDSFVALLARINRCVFWFHPLAWWLERELARLAEQACDDAAVAATEDRQNYARTLLDMARAVQTHGRFLTSGMAKEANVETRINRILDESRNIPKALGKIAWTILLACAAPLIYLAATAQLAPAQTLMSIPAPAAPPAPAMVAQAAPAPPEPPPRQPQTAKPEQPQQPTAAPPATLWIPKLYNGRNKTFFFFGDQDFVGGLSDEKIVEEDRLFDAVRASELITRAAAQMRQQRQPGTVVDSGLKVSVDLSVQGSASIAIPFPETDGKYDIIALLREENGPDVLNNRLTGVTGTKWNVQVALEPGKYLLRVLVRNTTDGKISTNQTNFEVK